MTRSRSALVAGLSLSLVSAISLIPAATLPPHPPLRILIVSDEVNPHGLGDAELTQPGDLSAALLTPANGLNLDPSPDGVVEIPTNQIETATALLAVPADDPQAYDVLIYFAHRIPDNGNDAAGRQAAFTAAVESFLEGGGGVVSFHHGCYLSPGKEAILDIIGATATGAVPWNTTDGQNVIDVAPGHFVTENGVGYTGTVSYGDPGRGVLQDDYAYFNNVPDERYPSLAINAGAGDVEILFASDYDEGGTTHVLGLTHRRPTWTGTVVVYQPGEYQPNALDVTGNNFQVLANAILYSAAAWTEPLDVAVSRGPGPQEVTLQWTGGAPYFTVFRSTDASIVQDPANELGQTASATWTELPPPADVLFYSVLGD